MLGFSLGKNGTDIGNLEKEFFENTGDDLYKVLEKTSLLYGVFIGCQNDLLFYNTEHPDIVEKILDSLSKQYRKRIDYVTDAKLLKAIKLSMNNSRADTYKMSSKETYLSNVLFTQDVLKAALVGFKQGTMNPLAYIRDKDNYRLYKSVILFKKDGKDRTKFNYCIPELIPMGEIEHVFAEMYHPLVWQLLITGNAEMLTIGLE